MNKEEIEELVKNLENSGLKVVSILTKEDLEKLEGLLQ